MLRRSAAENSSPESRWHIAQYLFAAMSELSVEQFRVLYFGNKGRLIGEEVLWEGTVDTVQVHPREVLRRTIDVGALHLLIAHNHPSGDPKPSMDDVAVTRQICRGCSSLGIDFVDHIVVGRAGFVSMREAGMI